MDVSKIGTLVVGIVVAALLLCTILIPVIAANVSETSTINNTGAYFTTPDDDEHTLIFSTDFISYDGESFDWPVGFGTGNSRNVTLMIGDDWMVRADSNYGRILVSGPPHAFTIVGYPASGDITATITGTSVSFTGGTNDVELTDMAYTIADKGDYVMTYNPYITADTPLIGGVRYQQSTPPNDIFEIVSGSVGDIDNMTATACRVYLADQSPSTGDIVSNTWVANTESVTTNLLRLTDIKQTATLYNNTTSEITISYLIVPETIVYDNPDYVGSQMASLLGIIPLLVTVGIILGVVGMTLSRRE